MDPTLEKLDINDPSGLENWHERFEIFTATHSKITASTKHSWYLSLIGKDAYDLVKVLAFPDSLGSKTITELQALLTSHLRPTHYESTERAKFHNLSRKTDETFRGFLLRIQRQAAKCNFNSDLQTQMRDRIVAGVNDSDLQMRLLRVKKLTFEKAKEILETANDINDDVTRPMSNTVLYNKGGQSSKPWPRSGQDQQNKWHTLAPAKQTSPKGTTRGACNSCGGDHKRQACRFRDAVCHKCKKKGHIMRVCRSREMPSPRSSTKPVKMAPTPVNVVVADQEVESNYLALAVTGNNHLLHRLTFPGGRQIDFVVDTGSPITFLPDKQLFAAEPTTRLHPTQTTITSVSGHALPVVGEAVIKVEGESSNKTDLKMIVTQGGLPVLGLDGLRALDVKVVLQTTTPLQVQKPQSNFSSHLPRAITDLIHDCGKCTGGMKVEPVTLEVSSPPIFCKARPIPFNIRGAVQKNLQELVEAGILTEVPSSAWGTPIVTPLKPNGLPRICGDFKVTVNPFLKQTACTTLPVEDMFAGLQNNRIFSKIDLTNAFLQIPLEEASKEITTIHTPFGLFRFNYLPFGLTISPGEFQKRIDSLISGLQGTKAYQDDILVFGVDQKQHNERLYQLLQVLKRHNVLINPAKSLFGVTQLNYLGYCVDGDGFKPDLDRIATLLKAPKPTSKKELQSFLGFTQYYSKFLPNHSQLTLPLYKLLKAEEFSWTDEADQFYNKLLQALLDGRVLRSFQTGLQSDLVVDASDFAIGGVLEQDGQPVVCVSRKLSQAECNYSQTQREALAIVWCVRRLHKYLYGSKFRIISDHRALQHIFDPKASLSKTSSAMLQRWATELSSYTFTIQHKPGKEIPQADYLSRCAFHDPPPSSSVMLTNPLPISRNRLIEETKLAYGPVLAAVKRGWSTSAKRRFPELYSRRQDLNLQADGVVLVRDRPLIPPSCRNDVLQHLHAGHLGRDKMMSLSRLLCWWPTINTDLQIFLKGCVACQAKPRQHLQWKPWPVAFQPMQRLHADYCGPFLGQHYALVVEDAYSKYPDVFLTTSPTAGFTKTAFRKFFSKEGVPQVVVSDNGTHFTGQQLQAWMDSIGCKSVFSAPRHPCSNGLAERFIKTLKIAISTSAPTNLEELHQCINIFLLQYRNAVHPSTGRTPAMLFKGRNLRTALNLDSTDVTYYRGNGSQPRRGLLIHQIGSRMYHLLDRDDGSVHRRHIDQINISPTTATESAPFTPEDLPTIPAPMQTELTESPGSTSPAQETQSLPSPIEPKPQLRRSARYRKKPDRYGFV